MLIFPLWHISGSNMYFHTYCQVPFRKLYQFSLQWRIWPVLVSSGNDHFLTTFDNLVRMASHYGLTLFVRMNFFSLFIGHMNYQLYQDFYSPGTSVSLNWKSCRWLMMTMTVIRAASLVWRPVDRALHTLPHFLLITTNKYMYDYFHFKAKNTDAGRNWVTYSKHKASGAEQVSILDLTKLLPPGPRSASCYIQCKCFP